MSEPLEIKEDSEKSTDAKELECWETANQEIVEWMTEPCKFGMAPRSDNG